jgi:hypothetical protein
MQKPYIQYRPAPKDRGQITDRLREFFRILEGDSDIVLMPKEPKL